MVKGYSYDGSEVAIQEDLYCFWFTSLLEILAILVRVNGVWWKCLHVCKQGTALVVLVNQLKRCLVVSPLAEMVLSSGTYGRILMKQIFLGVPSFCFCFFGYLVFLLLLMVVGFFFLQDCKSSKPSHMKYESLQSRARWSQSSLGLEQNCGERLIFSNPRCADLRLQTLPFL